MSSKFKMEGMETIRELLRIKNRMVKVELKDAYFTIPIHPRHQSHTYSGARTHY